MPRCAFGGTAAGVGGGGKWVSGVACVALALCIVVIVPGKSDRMLEGVALRVRVPTFYAHAAGPCLF